MLCANCNQPRAHRSHSRGVRDRVYRLFQMIPYRCQACKARFYAYRGGEKSSKLRTHEERKIMELRRRIKWKATRKQLILFGLGALVTLSALYLLIQQRVR